MLERTIYALCTPPLSGALHVIRVCGPQTYDVVSSICQHEVVKQGHVLQHTFIVEDGVVLDEVVLAKFVAPRSYTGEDTVEISCHGGMAVVGSIISLLNARGLRQAERGEFTKMAVLNNKIDLIQAESVDAIVRAPSKEGVVHAGRGLVGKTSAMVKEFKESLLQAIALVEVNIDYPEYDDFEHADANKLLAMVNPLVLQAQQLVEMSERVVRAFKGISVAIVGRPNVGKSSLLNALIGQDKAIVSPVAGTTRDIVEGAVVLNGVPVSFLDTAGIRQARGFIEGLGVSKAKEQIGRADLVIVVVDGSKALTAIDKKILDSVKKTNFLVVKAKSDLVHRCRIRGIPVSSKKNDLQNLFNALRDAFKSAVALDGESALLNERQTGLMRSAHAQLKDVANSLQQGATVDLAAQGLQAALADIKTILGEQPGADLLDEIFSRFCLGK